MRYEAWINGVGLTTLSDKIYLTDIQESAPKLAISTIENAKYGGLRMTERTRQRLDVTLTFSVRERNGELRAEILDDILTWIADGELSISTRPNQVLQVKYTDIPSVGSSLRWTDTLSVTFTEYNAPYWLAAQPVRKSVSCVSGTPSTIVIAPVGTAETTFLEFSIEANANVGTVAISANGYTLTFTSVGAVSGGIIAGYYDADGYQHFTLNGVSIYGKRTGDDDILLNCRQPNTITVTTNGAATFTAIARGRYL